MHAKVRAAIAAIPEDAWTPITYPRAVWDEDQGRLISDAQVAEVPYTAFASRKGQAITARLIVRRVRDLNRKAAAGQGELFACWRYHAVLTDSPFEMIQAEAQHRDHAIVEQVFADWNDGPLAHLPSGHFPANAAWLTCAAICHNLTRAAGDARRARPRPGPRRDHPPPPHQRRGPHRPPRPRPHHPPPARGLAPRAQLDDPLRGRLRPARRPGLTSPARSPHPRTAPAATRPSPRQNHPDKPQNTPAAGTPRP